MIEIIPAVMPRSKSDLEEKISLVAEHVSLVQIDVMDGKLTPARSWPYFSSDEMGFEAIASGEEAMPYWEKVDFEIDLMVEKPEEVIEKWILAGASRIIFHIEAKHNFEKIVELTKGRVDLGVALNPSSHTDLIDATLEDVQFVQFMGIDRIGFQGEKFNESVIDKVRDFHNAHPEIVISIDGGVGLDYAKALVDAGATRLVSGSTIFNSNNPSGAIAKLKSLV